MKKIATGILGVLLITGLASAKTKYQTWNGEITDSECAKAGSHTEMMKKHGAKDANDCSDKCVKEGAKYVLLDPSTKKIYQLDDQLNSYEFAGYKVAVTGTLDSASNTIHVHDIEVTSW